MKCPKCAFITSNTNDVCPRCSFDLRRRKAELGIRVANPKATKEEIIHRMDDSDKEAAELYEGSALTPQAEEKKGFFGRLFGRSHKSEADTVVTTIIEEMEPQEFEEQVPDELGETEEELPGEDFEEFEGETPESPETIHARSASNSDTGAGLNEVLPESEETPPQEYPESDVFQLLNTLHTPAEAFSESLEESLEEAKNAAEQLRAASKLSGELPGNPPKQPLPLLRSEIMAKAPTVSPKVLEIGDDFDLDGALDELLGEHETVTTVAVEPQKKAKPLKKQEEDEFEFSFEIEDESETEDSRIVAAPDPVPVVEPEVPAEEPPALEESRDEFLDELVENLRSIEAQAEEHSIATQTGQFEEYSPPPPPSQAATTQTPPTPQAAQALLPGELDQQRILALQKAQEVLAKLGTVDQSILSELSGVIANAYGLRPETFTPPPSRPESEFEVADRHEVVERETVRAKLAKFVGTEGRASTDPMGEISSLEAELYGEMRALEAGGTHIFSIPENRPGLQETEAFAEGFQDRQGAHSLPPTADPSEEQLLSIESGLIAELSNLEMEELGEAVDGSGFQIEVDPPPVSEAPSPLAEMEDAVTNVSSLPEPGASELGIEESAETPSGSRLTISLGEHAASEASEPLEVMEQDAIFREIESLLTDDMGEPPPVADIITHESPTNHVAVFDSSPELAAIDSANVLTEVPISPHELGLDAAETERLRLKILRSKPTQIFSSSDLAFLRNLPPLDEAIPDVKADASESEASVEEADEPVVQDPLPAPTLLSEALHYGSESGEEPIQYSEPEGVNLEPAMPEAANPEPSPAVEQIAPDINTSVPDFREFEAFQPSAQEELLGSELDSLLQVNDVPKEGALENETSVASLPASPEMLSLSETETLLSDELDSLLGDSTSLEESPELSSQADVLPETNKLDEAPELTRTEQATSTPFPVFPELTGVQAELSDELDALLNAPMEQGEILGETPMGGGEELSIPSMDSSEHISIAESLSEAAKAFEEVSPPSQTDDLPVSDVEEESEEDIADFLFQEDDILAHVSQAVFHGDSTERNAPDEIFEAEAEPSLSFDKLSDQGIPVEHDFEGLFSEIPKNDAEEDIFATESDEDQQYEDEASELDISFEAMEEEGSEPDEDEFLADAEDEADADDEELQTEFEQPIEDGFQEDNDPEEEFSEPVRRELVAPTWEPPQFENLSGALSEPENDDDEAGPLWGAALQEIRALAVNSDEFEISTGELSSFMQTATIDVLFNAAIEEILDPQKLAARLNTTSGNTLQKIDSRELETAVLKYQREERIYRTKQAERRMRPARSLEQIPLGNLGARCLAFILDSLCILGVVFVISIFFIFPEAVRRELFLLQTPSLDDVLPNLFTALYFGLGFWIAVRTLTVLGYGAGPGGRLFKLEVVDYEGRALGPKQSLLRACAELTYVITFTLSLLPVIGKTRRTIHDRLAKTLVAKRSNFGMTSKPSNTPVRPSHTGQKIVSKSASKRTPSPKAPVRSGKK